MADYNSNYTGQEIDEAVGKALSPDSSPTSGSQALVTSGGVAAGLSQKASASDVNAMAEKIPSGASSSNKLVTQADIANFITRSVNDLVNYYLKSDTYTKQEVHALIAAINQFHYEVYESLSDVTSPVSNVLYLIGPTGSGSDKYEEYVYSNSTFVKIGDTSIDLSGYVTTQALNAALATKVNISDIVDNLTTDDATKVLSAKQGKALDGKVSQLGQKMSILGPVHRGYINNGNWEDLTSVARRYIVIELPGVLDNVPVSIKAASAGQSVVAYLNAYNPVEGGSAGVIIMRNINKDFTYNDTIPQGTKYIYFLYDSGGVLRIPQKFLIAGIDIIKETPFVALSSILSYNVARNLSYRLWSLGHKPDINSANNTLTFSDETTITVGTKSYTIPANTVVSLEASGSYYSTIVYNLTSGTFSAVPGTANIKLLEDEIQLGFAVTGGTDTVKRYYFPFNYTIDGKDIDNLNEYLDFEFINKKWYGRGYITNGKWADIGIGPRYYYCIPIFIHEGSKYEILFNASTSSVLYFLSDNNPVSGQSAGAVSIAIRGTNTTAKGTVPASAKYLYILAESSGSRMPQKIIIDNIDYTKQLKEHVAQLGNLIQDEGSILTLNPKKEVIAKIRNLKRRYITYGGSATEWPPVLSFIHTSDFHADNTNIVRAKEFFDEYSDYADFMLDTGDFIGGQITDGLPTAVSQVPNMLRVIGNHDTTVRTDTSPNYSWVTASQLDCYNTNFKDYIGNWNVIQPANAATYGYCYYYKDFTDSNVRLICLDGEHWGGDDESNPDTIQLTWFQGVLASAKTAGLHVIVAVHRPPFYVNRIDGNTFDSIDFPSMRGVKTLDGAIAAINAFKEEENGVSGNFICWLCGHIHQDCMGLGRDTNTQNQLVISIATASVAPSLQYSEMARVNGEKSQDCLNIVGIDTHTKIIKLMRVGAQYDRHMRRRNTLCWDYENNQLIYCD